MANFFAAGRKNFGSRSIKSVLEASAKLINRIYEFADSHSDRRLMRIAEDNVIDQDERPEFDAILSDIQEIVEAALAVKCARQGE